MSPYKNVAIASILTTIQKIKEEYSELIVAFICFVLLGDVSV